MKPLMNRAAATLSGVGLFCIACVMAGIGLAAVAILTVFGLAAAGLTVLVAPFATTAKTQADEAASAQPSSAQPSTAL